jgi:CAI-1 autoinducer synthase
MQNALFSATALPVTAPRTAPVPDFLMQRIQRFYDERVGKAWGGRHILRGRRAGPGSLNLQNNDYLDIARHPQIVQAQTHALATAGNGEMMSALFVQQADNPLRVLEQQFATDLGYESAILCQSGYNANVGLIQSIANERTPVYVDMFAHASLWEGARSGGATVVPVLHNDLDHLERQILRHGAGVVLVDSVYSIDGSVCPLRDMARLTSELGCIFVVDESHALGTHGALGQGLVAAQGLQDQVHFVTASLAKAYCARAGLITCAAIFKDYFGCEALPAIFSSTLLPSEIAAIQAAHDVVRREGWRRARLAHVTATVRNELLALGYPIADGSEQIIALEAGIELLTGQVRDALEEEGIFGAIFSAPATPKNRSLLRLTLNAGMTDAHIAQLVDAMRRVRDRVDLPNWSASRRRQRVQRNTAWVPLLEAVA